MKLEESSVCDSQGTIWAFKILIKGGEINNVESYLTRMIINRT